jgi:hypothetical protein
MLKSARSLEKYVCFEQQCEEQTRTRCVRGVCVQQLKPRRSLGFKGCYITIRGDRGSHSCARTYNRVVQRRGVQDHLLPH